MAMKALIAGLGAALLLGGLGGRAVEARPSLEIYTPLKVAMVYCFARTNGFTKEDAVREAFRSLLPEQLDVMEPEWMQDRAVGAMNDLC